MPFVNRGTVAATSGELKFANGGSSESGAWSAGAGAKIVFSSGSFALSHGSLSGAIGIEGSPSSVSAEAVAATAAKITLSSNSGSLNVISGTMTIETLTLVAGEVTGAGTLKISSSLLWTGGGYYSSFSGMTGAGETVLQHGATATIMHEVVKLVNRKFLNEGSVVFENSELYEGGTAVLDNAGTFVDNSEYGSPQINYEPGTSSAVFVNVGLLEKTAGTGKAVVEPKFENYGTVRALTGAFEFLHPVIVAQEVEYGPGESPSARWRVESKCGDPVSCATGNFSETQTDLEIGGRGVGLSLARTYNSQAAAAGEHGAFGYGWTSSFSDRLVVEKTSKTATLHQASAGTVPFVETSEGTFTAPSWSSDTLTGNSTTGYTVTLPNQVKYKFAGSTGRLESVTDRNGNATTLGYSEGGRLEAITDPSARKITLTYNTEGLVESAQDPMGHIVKYTYLEGNLATVTQPAETALRWQFKYNSTHEWTTMTDGRGGKTINEYNGANQVTSQKDPTEHTVTFEYEPLHTKITNTATGSVTDEYFTSTGELSSITRGYGTAAAATETYTYNESGYVASETDANGHATQYGYNGAGDRTSVLDPNGNETKWTYDTTHDVETATSPSGETTSIERDTHGNPIKVSRPAPSAKTQVTKYKYTSHGEVESTTDPLERTTKYEYNSDGDRIGETRAEGDKRTWEYNADSQETATVSPRGNVIGGEPAKYTTKVERDAQGRAITITNPLEHKTKYAYDGDGNVEVATDPNGNATKYVYNADNSLTKTEEPNGSTTETGYDGAQQTTSQIDGNKHSTKYVRNSLEQIIEATDPLERKTTKEYDGAGNLKTMTDAAKRTTAYTYDAGNRVKEITYSDGITHALEYEYDKDGDITTIKDGTGTTKDTYDQLDRLIETENGHKEVTKYEYDLANEITKITYPNGKAVTRAYDKDGRLEKVTDWAERVTKFTYDSDSDPASTVYPAETKDEDKLSFNAADEMSEVKMLKSAESLASLVYTRDNNGQLKGATSKGLPGEEKPTYEYDANSRLKKGAGVPYEYDSANNLTKQGTGVYKYGSADELESRTGNTYAYNEVGQRIKMIPTTGTPITYGYDQAGNLTTVERETPAIKDTYTYDGRGLRASQKSAGVTTYLDWNSTEAVPTLLSDGTNSYIYGPGGLPVEQVNNTTGTVLYLHDDQQGSTRLLTDSTGKTVEKCTYSPYGECLNAKERPPHRLAMTPNTPTATPGSSTYATGSTTRALHSS